MAESIVREIQRLRGLSVAELRAEWQRLYCESTRSRNRDYLFRRLAWRVQELTLGGLSERARTRIDEIAPDGFRRVRTPSTPTIVPPPEPKRPVRDLRLPSPGTVIVRQYRGRELRLTVLDDGFELDGSIYRSLSEAARAVTGQRWNGPLFWGLRKRNRRT